MNRIFSSLNNQQGSVMAIALMIMVTLTVVGLAAINDTLVESAIARNHALYRYTMYLAEAAARQAAQVMEDYADNPAESATICVQSQFPAWLKTVNFNIGDDVDWANLDFRGDGGATNYDEFQASVLANGNENASGYLVVFRGIAPGASLDMSDPTSLYEYAVYGRGVGPMKNDRTSAIVRVGYLMRF